MDSNSIGSSADFKNAKKITTRFKIWPTHFLENIIACRQIAQLGGVRHWTITTGFCKGKNDIEHVFIFSLHPPIRYQNSINADMRVTVVNHISPEKSVIKTSSIDGMSGNNAFADVAGLSHSTVVRKGSGFLDAKGRMILGFEIRVNYVLNKNFLMRWNFYDKLSTDFFVFEFEKSGKVKKLYAKTWLLRFHSPVIARMLDSGVNKLRIVGKEGYKDYDKFLQIVHGVDLALNEAVCKIAKRFQVEAITRKYETAVLLVCHKDNLDLFLTSVELNFPTVLRVLLKQVKTVEKLKEVVQDMKSVKMSGEIMKQLAEKMFSFVPKDLHLYSNKYSKC